MFKVTLKIVMRLRRIVLYFSTFNVGGKLFKSSLLQRLTVIMADDELETYRLWRIRKTVLQVNKIWYLP